MAIEERAVEGARLMAAALAVVADLRAKHGGPESCTVLAIAFARAVVQANEEDPVDALSKFEIAVPLMRLQLVAALAETRDRRPAGAAPIVRFPLGVKES